jgi:hypothetical protein
LSELPVEAYTSYLIFKFGLPKFLQEIGHDSGGGLEDSTADSAEEKSVTYPKNMVSPVREVCKHARNCGFYC